MILFSSACQVAAHTNMQGACDAGFAIPGTQLVLLQWLCQSDGRPVLRTVVPVEHEYSRTPAHGHSERSWLQPQFRLHAGLRWPRRLHQLRGHPHGGPGHRRR